MAFLGWAPQRGWLWLAARISAGLLGVFALLITLLFTGLSPFGTTKTVSAGVDTPRSAPTITTTSTAPSPTTSNPVVLLPVPASTTTVEETTGTTVHRPGHRPRPNERDRPDPTTTRTTPPPAPQFPPVLPCVPIFCR
ncbi:hypothetical protein D5S17_33425 [Pseudonocardiaceae bacterium YIM PH 21723]|nr:hypothetical protein D5S17_33425 [Pseudonocardiaceae bacterium YIM PH 21723]